MNLKFCEKVLLLFNTDYSFSQVKVFPPHRKKEAEKERLSSQHKETHLIEVSNSNFRLKFLEFRTKYYGSLVRLELDHPEFKDYPPLNEGEHSLVVSTDTYGFSEIIMKSGLDHGFSYEKTFSFDLYTNAWYQECYRLVPDNSSFIPEQVSNYREFWESPKVSTMQPGSVYLDRWGDIYLALTDKVYSNTIGSGYSGGVGNYTLYSGRTLYYPSEKRPSTIMAYLGNSKDILEHLSGIGSDYSSLLKFFEDLFQRRINHLSKFSLGTDFLRIKGYSCGHFVKLLEIPGYESLYKSILSWKGIREIIFGLSDRYTYNQNDDDDSIFHLEKYFHVTSEKTVEKLDSILSDNEKLIYRKYILNTIKDWKLKYSSYEYENYSKFYSPQKGDKSFTFKEINDFLAWKAPRTYLLSLKNFWNSATNFINLGLFKDENDFINEFEIIRKS